MFEWKVKCGYGTGVDQQCLLVKNRHISTQNDKMEKERVDKNLKLTKTTWKEKDKGKHGWKVANTL